MARPRSRDGPRADPATVRARQLGRNGLDAARPATLRLQPASCPGPTDPALRANPFPEVTDPACRLPLPTLFYRPEAVHLGDLLRLWVRPEARVPHSPPDFQGPTGAHRTPPRRGALRSRSPYLRSSRFQGSRSLQRKDNSSRGPGRRLRARSLRSVGRRKAAGSAFRFGNIDPIPFRSRGVTRRQRDGPRLRSERNYPRP